MPLNQKLTGDELSAVNCMMAGIEPFREIRTTMPMQYIHAFLLVAQNEGRSVTDYAKAANVSKSVMSRHLLDIGEFARDMSPGFGLVVSKADYADSRNKLYYVSPKGRTVIKQIQRALTSSR